MHLCSVLALQEEGLGVEAQNNSLITTTFSNNENIEDKEKIHYSLI